MSEQYCANSDDELNVRFAGQQRPLTYGSNGTCPLRLGVALTRLSRKTSTRLSIKVQSGCPKLDEALVIFHLRIFDERDRG